MTTSTALNQQVWVGAGASATMIPEMKIYLDACTVKTDTTSVDDVGLTTTAPLIPNLYVGCMAEIRNNDTSSFNGTAMITANTTTEVSFDRVIGANDNDVDVTILAFGAPSPAPSITKSTDTGSDAENIQKPTLLGDNWLGLVNTVTPPSVDIELGQVSLALAGRNFGYQFKKNETVSGGSLDLSLNNGSWFYYALGNIANVIHSQTAQNIRTESERHRRMFSVSPNGHANWSLLPLMTSDSSPFAWVIFCGYQARLKMANTTLPFATLQR